MSLGDEIRALAVWHLSAEEMSACLRELARKADRLEAALTEKGKS